MCFRVFAAALLLVPPLAAQGPSDPKEMEAFFDGLFAAQKEAHHLAGMTLAVVRDGRILFTRGYGYADAESRRPVDPATSMFRIASISKTFVWTGLMQLSEQGKLDLKADVRKYAPDIAIPEAFGTPITVENLMTHTPGLEDRPLFGLFSRTPAQASLAELLQLEIPGRFFPPGEVLSYSNWGSALAGLILERVSGMSYADYLEKNILAPLGMRHTTPRQPVPKPMEPDLAVGHKYTNGQLEKQGFEFVPLAPAGGMSASAEDIAHYMIAHLQLGRYGTTRILREDTARLMQQVLFTHDPRLAGWLHGFIQYRRGGVTAFGHGGATMSFFSNMLLFPETGTGIFCSYNSDTGSAANSQAFNAIADHYFPSTASGPPPKPSPEAAGRARRIAGWYAGARRPRNGFGKLAVLMTAVKLEPAPDGHLLAKGEDATRHFYEIEPWVFTDRDGKQMVIFRPDPSGEVNRGSGPMPIADLERISLFQTALFNAWLLIPAALLLVSAVVVFPLAGLTNIARRTPSARGPKWARIAAWIAAACFTVYLAFVAHTLQKGEELVFGVPSGFTASFWFARAGAVAAVIVLVLAVRAWPRRYWTFWVRAHYTLVAVAGCVIVWSAWRWSLL